MLRPPPRAMVTALALSAALCYGVADFFGGAASRRTTALAVLLVSVPIGLGVLAAAALAVGGTPTAPALTWGLASGLASGGAFLAFYRALAKGPMSVVAPVTALAAAVVPVAAGLVQGERPSVTILAGVALCMGAIALVSVERGRPADGGRGLDRGPVLAIAAGVGFGFFFVLVSAAGDGAGLWPLVASRTGVLVVIVAAVLVLARTTGRRLELRPLRAGSTPALVLGAGALDVLANIAYFKASTAGLLSVVAVLTSLYPAITVLLARIVHGERLRLVQRLGLLVALSGVVLVTAG